MARPAYRPTDADRSTVKLMASCGFRHELIAECLGTDGIDDKTLRKHFRRELNTASALANAVIGNQLFLAASRGEPWAVCFWMKCRAGFTEKQMIEHSSALGAPVRLLVEYTDKPKPE